MKPSYRNNQMLVGDLEKIVEEMGMVKQQLLVDELPSYKSVLERISQKPWRNPLLIICMC
jgi:hypothetical protein